MKPLTFKRKSLKIKIFSYLLCFSALLLLILWLLQTVFLDSFYRNIRVNEIKNVANSASGEPLDYTAITAASERTDCYVEIMTAAGTEIFSYGDFKNRMPAFSKLSLIENLGDRTEHVEYLTVSPRDNRLELEKRKAFESIVFIKRLSNGNLVLTSSQITPVDATVATLRYQLYLVTAIMLLLSVIIAIIISKRISKPIENINSKAKELSKGNYDLSFSDFSYKEIGELSDTLNTAAADLGKVDALRRELIANISHDLRTPLSLIYGYAEMMNDFPGEMGPEHLETIMNETRRLSDLVTDLMDISNLEAGTIQLKLCDYDLSESLKATIARMQNLTEKDGYVMQSDIEYGLMVTADEIKITQVFYNLLTNAIHYAGGDKTVTISAGRENGRVIVRVSDNGDGIEQDKLPLVWDRYYKIDKEHKRAVTGTGLGLSIVKKIMLLHGGEYGVVSTVGKGSTFWFSL